MPIPCFECNDPAVENHHVVPVFRGGTRTVGLCVKHHALVHEKSLLASVLTREALALKKERGEFLGRTPYGWKLDKNTGTLVADPAQQATLHRVRDLLGQKMSYRLIRETLKAEGMVLISVGTINCIARGKHQTSLENPPTFAPKSARSKTKVSFYKDIVALAEMRAFLDGLPKDTRIRIVRYLADEILPKVPSPVYGGSWAPHAKTSGAGSSEVFETGPRT